MRKLWSRLPIWGATLLVAGGLVYAFWPKPLEVDLGAAARGTLRVTVDEDGQTRIKERYIVSAPLAGQLLRIQLDEGDAVEAGTTLLAEIEPVDPALLDARARAEAEARVSSAEAALQQAAPNLERAKAEFEQADIDYERYKKAFEETGASRKEYDDARLRRRIAEANVTAGQFAVDIARFELQQAKAALLRTRPGGQNGDDASRFRIVAPCSGRVLRVVQESAAVVQPGAALLEIGDPTVLEVVIDVLSTDAVSIRPGAEVLLERWGGEQPLRGVVRLVEPAGFTKISALGVEEQRVNVVIDFVDPLEARQGLGDAYRVEARIVVWQGEDVLKVPTSALFRHGDQWAVFTQRNGQAALTPVTLGRRNDLEAEILSGLAEGDRVILYPGDRVTDGVKVVERTATPGT